LLWGFDLVREREAAEFLKRFEVVAGAGNICGQVNAAERGANRGV